MIKSHQLTSIFDYFASEVNYVGEINETSFFTIILPQFIFNEQFIDALKNGDIISIIQYLTNIFSPEDLAHFLIREFLPIGKNGRYCANTLVTALQCVIDHKSDSSQMNKCVKHGFNDILDYLVGSKLRHLIKQHKPPKN